MTGNLDRRRFWLCRCPAPAPCPFLAQELLVGCDDTREVLRKSRHARGGIESVSAKLAQLAREKAFDGGGARAPVKASIDLAARPIYVFGRAPGVRNDHGKSACDRFRNAEPERFVRACVHEHVGAGKRGSQPLPVPFEAGEPNPWRCTVLDAFSFGAIAEENEDGLAMHANPGKGVEYHVPSLLEREATDGDEQCCGSVGVAEELRSSSVSPR